jgi:hypothetical protein
MMPDSDDTQPGREMPCYKCHKEVWALKIAKIDVSRDPVGSSSGAKIYPVEEGYAPFQVDGAYVMKHNPKAGGYYVVYDDGYKSFSPAKAFDEGYTRITK